MNKINRRKFISMFASGIIGISIYQNKATGLSIEVNRFNINKSISLQNVHSIAVKIKEINIISNNINYENEATLTVHSKIEDLEIGKVMSKSIDLNDDNDSFGPYKIRIEDKEAFSEEKYADDKSNLNVYITFKLNHPSLKKEITEEVVYEIPIDASGELNSWSFSEYSSFEAPKDTSMNNYETVSGSDLHVLTSSGFEQIKDLIGGGGLKDNTSSDYTVPSDMIDVKQNKFEYSSPRDYRNILNGKPDNNLYDLE